MANSETGTRSRGFIWWGATVVALLAGYAFLARGDETISPLLLVAGYCVLVPLAILKS